MTDHIAPSTPPTSPDPIALMLQHRSVRRFTDAPVPGADIRRAVEAGQAASTSSAVQAYAVIHVRDDTKRVALSELAGPQEKVASCGAFFVYCGDTRRHRLAVQRTGQDYDARFEAFLIATIDATLFAQNMVLAFEAMGYGICYIGGLRNNLAGVDDVLRTPHGVYPLFGLCVGVPAEEPSPRPRLPIESVLFEDAYPDDATLTVQLDFYDDAYRTYLRQRSAPERTWTDAMSQKFAHPKRTDVAPFFINKGADLR